MNIDQSKFVQCLAIRTSDPRSVCWAGGELVGDVSLILTEPTLIRGIQLSYRCEAHVDFVDDGNDVEEEDVIDVDVTGFRKHKRDHRLGFSSVIPKRKTAVERFLETTILLWGTEPHTSYGEVMPAGHHCLAFDIRVPQNLPGSFEGHYGFVRHWLECVVDRPEGHDMKTSRALSVISNCDLNLDPFAMKSLRYQQEVTLCCGCIKPDHYDVSFELPYRGYVPGETMFPDVKVRNYTRHRIQIFVKLKMITTYKARNSRKTTIKVIAEEKKVVHKTEVSKWEPSLQVPALPPTGLGGCNIIEVRFFLELELKSHGIGWQGLAFQDEIQIGTIPLSHVANVRQVPLKPVPRVASPALALLLCPPQTQISRVKTINGTRVPLIPAIASSGSTGDGRLTSDTESSAAVSVPKPALPVSRHAASNDRGRSTSVFSATSHWSFHQKTNGPRLYPGHLANKLFGKKEHTAKKKSFKPSLPTIYN